MNKLLINNIRSRYWFFWSIVGVSSRGRELQNG